MRNSSFLVFSRKLHASRGRFGALTSKPYAFVARPWELQSVHAIDNMNALGANIQLQTRGNELMRILPRTNDDINDDWIDDKTRFSYDGLKAQRIVKPLCRDTVNPNLWDRNTFNWKDVFARVKTAFDTLKDPKENHVRFRAIVGPTSDMYSVLALSDFSELVQADASASSVEMLGTNLSNHSSDPANYRFNASIVGVQEADVCLLVGTNMNIDNPLFAMRFMDAFREDEIRFSQIGPDNGLHFPVEHLGLSLKVLDDIANESHPYFKVLADAEKPMIILDASLFEREDSDAILNTVEKLAAKTNLRRISESGVIMWNGISVLHKYANDVGLLDFGRLVGLNSSHPETDILYLMNVQTDDFPNGVYDVRKLADSGKFIIYQGSHGDDLAGIADVVFPGAAYSEKSGVYTNLEGRAQLSHRALTPPGIGKNDWTILRALSEVLGDQLPYNSEEEIQARLESLVPNTEYSNLGELQYPDFVVEGAKSFGNSSISDMPFVREKNDFYLDGHAIARASKVMAASSKDKIEGHRNFIDY